MRAPRCSRSRRTSRPSPSPLSRRTPPSPYPPQTSWSCCSHGSCLQTRAQETRGLPSLLTVYRRPRTRPPTRPRQTSLWAPPGPPTSFSRGPAWGRAPSGTTGCLLPTWRGRAPPRTSSSRCPSPSPLPPSPPPWSSWATSSCFSRGLPRPTPATVWEPFPLGHSRTTKSWWTRRAAPWPTRCSPWTRSTARRSTTPRTRRPSCRAQSTT
mmetsp:Transcript_2186/g.4858  ORF Transcript_2186/g.4858 Transcript_2186/m.4858 type:complete len:210 (+) Transcript_2186:1945-2574(+)